MLHRALMAFVLAITAPTIIGCQKSDLPQRAPVEGTVTLDGEPLTTGWVQFTPDTAAGNRGPVAVGPIDTNGRYRLKTDSNETVPDGAVLGTHRVSIEARAPRTSEIDTLPRLLIPERYTTAETSGLTAEVKPITVNEINFTLIRQTR